MVCAAAAGGGWRGWEPHWAELRADHFSTCHFAEELKLRGVAA